jgi:hypothetical protein
MRLYNPILGLSACLQSRHLGLAHELAPPEPLSPDHQVHSFACGESVLDE